MTSLAVFPPLQKSISDLMEEDIYQPGPGSLQAGSGMSPSLHPAQNPSSAAQTLSNLLNIPESFVEHYTRVNGSNSQLNSTVPSLFLDSTNDYSNFDTNALTRDTDELLPVTQQTNPPTQQQHFIRPEVLTNNFQSRRRRITTLEQPDMNTKKYNDEDYYLFNTEIQPSSLMTNNGSFYPNCTDDSFFIMDSDLDKSAHVGAGPASVPVPGFESDYVMMDNFAEESDFSDDSDDEDDDNYFQDDDFEDLTVSPTAPNVQLSSPAGYAPFESPLDEPIQNIPQLGGFMETLQRAPTSDSMDYGSEPEVSFPSQNSGVMVQNLQTNSHTDLFKREDEEPRSIPPQSYTTQHLTAAEITANNPTHECTLTNPSTGQPCHKHFSRPYDLIRHQETIHAAKKKIFRCVICEGREQGGAGNGKSKTFSRGDALSRHIKVKHGISGKDAADLVNEAKENVEYLSVC